MFRNLLFSMSILAILYGCEKSAAIAAVVTGIFVGGVLLILMLAAYKWLANRLP